MSIGQPSRKSDIATEKNFGRREMLFLDKLFQMTEGYVLNFSDRTMAEFFDDELGIDIDDPAYAKNGTSKANRLRTFLNVVDKQTAVRVLNALWDYRQDMFQEFGHEETLLNSEKRFDELIRKLEVLDLGPAKLIDFRNGVTDQSCLLALQSEFRGLVSLEQQERGYAFEKFLKRYFDAYDLRAREAFRLVGEQIDGSFLLDQEIYLLEAKWQSKKTGVQDLWAFNGRISAKAFWTRGLFISYEGFTDDGLQAVGRGNKFICMDGADIHQAFERCLKLDDILRMKVRHVAETGNPLFRVRDF